MYEPTFVYTDAMVNDLLTIERCRAQLELLPLTHASARDLAEAAKARRTHYSTSIEGNALSLGQVEEVIKGKAHGARLSAEQEVINYWDALTFLENAADGGRDLSEELIKELHAIITHKGNSAASSSYRGATPPGYLFAVRAAGSTAPVYVPPEWSDVGPMMRDLVAWYRGDSALPVPVRVAILHYRFVTIHPFEDGNGRTARALTTFTLTRGGYGLKGIGAMEEYYAAELDGYYASLQMGLPSNYYEGRCAPPHLEVWIEFFVRIMARNAERVCEAARAATASRTSHPLLRGLNARDKKMLRCVIESGALTIKPADLASVFSVTPRAVSKWCADWCERGILIANRAATRVMSYSLAPKYAELTEREIGEAE